MAVRTVISVDRDLRTGVPYRVVQEQGLTPWLVRCPLQLQREANLDQAILIFPTGPFAAELTRPAVFCALKPFEIDVGSRPEAGVGLVFLEN